MFNIFSLFRDDPRVGAFAALSKRRSWHFVKRINIENDELSKSSFYLFQQKGQHQAEGLTSIRAGEGFIRFFDHVNILGFQRRRTTVFEFRHPKLNVATFAVRPKKAFKGFREVFNNPHDALATTPDFDQNYSIFGLDESAIKRTVSFDFLDEFENDPGWTVEASGKYLIAYKEFQLVPIEDLEKVLGIFVDRCKKLDKHSYS